MRRPIRLRALVAVLAAAAVMRLLAIALIVPAAEATWFEPFLTYTLAHPSVDPWSGWLDSGGSADAFPYGPGMLLFFGAFAAAASVVPIAGAAQIGIAVGLLLIDAVVGAVIWRSSRRYPERGLILWALSPIVFFATYLHGQLDLLPSALLLLTFVDLRSSRSLRSGLWLGIAIATKASALLAVPLIVLLLVRDRRYRSRARSLLLGAAPGIAIALACLALPGYRRMVLASPQFESVFAFSVRLSSSVSLLIAPAIVLLVGALFWRFSRLNLDLLLLYSTVMLLVVPLLAPASPGWYLWSGPLLALLLGETRFRYLLMVWATWAALAIGGALQYSPGAWRSSSIPPNPTRGLSVLLPQLTSAVPWLPDTIRTAGIGMGLVTAAVLLDRLGRRFDQYRLSSAPFSLAVAGDSGTGKDTLCVSLAQVFGTRSTAFVMGDDYHRHERGAPAWRVRTHLDPAANDIARLVRDVVGLIRGDFVTSRHYDHAKGRFTEHRAIARGDLVVVSGLHVLTATAIRNAVDLTVFLDMDEHLRALLKVRRDFEERGHAPASTLASIQARAGDREAFIQPQEPLADLVLRLEPAQPFEFVADGSDVPEVPPLRLVLVIRGLTFAEDLQRALIALVALEVSVEYLREPGAVRLAIEGIDAVDTLDVNAVAQHLISRPQEVFVGRPSWLGGSFGLCQLVLALALLERRGHADEERSR